MTWIKTIAYGAAEGRLKQLYDRIKGPGDNVDNIMMAHSLRPHSMEGHMALYKAVLHHSGNCIDTWFLEALGVYASHLNGCAYCVEHHFAGLARLLARSGEGEKRAKAIRAALEADRPADALDARHAAALAYARALTLAPRSLNESDIEALRGEGWDDGEILEINQVVAYFNYANRFVLGVGIETEGDILGLSPGDTNAPDNWRHD